MVRKRPVSHSPSSPAKPSPRLARATLAPVLWPVSQKVKGAGGKRPPQRLPRRHKRRRRAEARDKDHPLPRIHGHPRVHHRASEEERRTCRRRQHKGRWAVRSGGGPKCGASAGKGVASVREGQQDGQTLQVAVRSEEAARRVYVDRRLASRRSNLAGGSTKEVRLDGRMRSMSHTSAHQGFAGEGEPRIIKAALAARGAVAEQRLRPPLDG